MKARRLLSVLAPALFTVVAILAAISLVARWPHQFGGAGSKAAIVPEFVSSGTATAPPLFVLVILGIAAFAARRSGPWGTLATVALLPLGALMVVGSLGEGLASPTPDVPRVIQYLSGGFGTIAGLLLFSVAAAALLERRRRTA